jgi:hypothetical protein
MGPKKDKPKEKVGTGGFGAIATAGVFGTTTATGDFGKPSVTTGGFGNAATTGFGSAPTTGFGSAPTTGFGSAPKTGGFGSAPTTGFGSAPTTGFGSAPTTGFGSAPTTGLGSAPTTGLGSAPAIGGFGSAPTTGFGSAPTTGFGSAPAIGGFGSAPTTGFGSAPAIGGFGFAQAKNSWKGSQGSDRIENIKRAYAPFVTNDRDENPVTSDKPESSNFTVPATDQFKPNEQCLFKAIMDSPKTELSKYDRYDNTWQYKEDTNPLHKYGIVDLKARFDALIKEESVIKNSVDSLQKDIDKISHDSNNFAEISEGLHIEEARLYNKMLSILRKGI